MKKEAIHTPHERYHVPNLKRALEVFELLAKNPDGMSLPEIARTTGYSKSSIFRIVCTLEDCGYVRKNSDERTIRMSRKLAALGYASFGESNIVEKSMDILRMMRDKIGETAMLGTLLEDACVLIEQAPGRHPFKFLGEVGMRISFNASAPGKAMLAFLPKDELEKRLAKMKFVKYNDNSICDMKTFRAELEKVRNEVYHHNKHHHNTRKRGKCGDILFSAVFKNLADNSGQNPYRRNFENYLNFHTFTLKNNCTISFFSAYY